MMNKKLKKNVNKKILRGIDKSWLKEIKCCLNNLNDKYLENLLYNNDISPEVKNLLEPFKTLKKEDVQYILFGQDPYPRKESASGYAFIDKNVKTIFEGENLSLSKEVNKAKSLRNLIKMILVSMEILEPKKTNKKNLEEKARPKKLINKIDELRKNFESNGVLLLNASLVYENKNRRTYHLEQWGKFYKCFLSNINWNIKFILLGKNAQKIAKIIETKSYIYKFEHPYNNSFIINSKVLDLFKPMSLLIKKEN